MNPRTINSLIIALFIFLVFPIEIAVSNTSGGSGDPVSPYPTDSEIDISVIEKVKDEASSSRTIEGVSRDGGKTFWGRNVGFAFTSSGKIVSDIKNYLHGKDEDGNEINIDLNQLDKIKVIKYYSSFFKKKALLNVVIFPQISPEMLLSNTPTYTDLLENYCPEISIVVDLRDAEGNQYSIVERRGSTSKLLIQMQSIRPEKTITFSYRLGSSPPIWWAVNSVTNDPAYPHRVSLSFD